MTIELTELKFTQEQISKQWPDVTYRGRDIIDLLVEMDNEMKPPYDNQECFMGWLPDKDVFIVGWDVWGEYDDDDEEEEVISGGHAQLIKVGGNDVDEFEKIREHTRNSLFYDGCYDYLRGEYPNMIELRLD